MTTKSFLDIVERSTNGHYVGDEHGAGAGQDGSGLPTGKPGNFMFATGIECSNPTIDNGRTRRDLLDECGHYERWAQDLALTRELGDAVAFTQPQGGLFFWARLTGKGGKTSDASEFAKRAIEHGVAFVPGVPFYAANPDTATFRLSFATADLGKIQEGVGRLARALAVGVISQQI